MQRAYALVRSAFSMATSNMAKRRMTRQHVADAGEAVKHLALHTRTSCRNGTINACHFQAAQTRELEASCEVFAREQRRVVTARDAGRFDSRRSLDPSR